MVGPKKRHSSGEYLIKPPRNCRKKAEPEACSGGRLRPPDNFAGACERMLRPFFQTLMWIWQELPASVGAYLAMKETALPCCSAISLTPCLNRTCMSAMANGSV